jgi:hypothetical protein
MPALPSVPKVLRFNVAFDLGEDLHAQCRFFKQYTGTAPAAADLTTLAAAERGLFNGNLAQLLATGLHSPSVTITDLSSPTSPVVTDSTNEPGSRGSGALPADICLLDSLQIARRYRGGHPRIYWPFGVQNDLADVQTWSDAFLAEAGGELSDYNGGIEAAVWAGGVSLIPVNVSYYEFFTVHTGTTGRARNISTPRAVPLVDRVTVGLLRKGLASQRRRLLRLA